METVTDFAKAYQQRFIPQIRAFQKILEKVQLAEPVKKILILGCGNGLEAAMAKQYLNLTVVGIDVVKDFDPQAIQVTNLLQYDGSRMPLADQYFDAVYSFHVLEHIERVEDVLAEVQRVTRPNGVIYFGVPNKSRLLGYFGMKSKTFGQKFAANVYDWKKRITGKWQNKFAHAGFSETELSKLLQKYFKDVKPVTHLYYSEKWPKLKNILQSIQMTKIDRVVLPSVYVIGRNL